MKTFITKFITRVLMIIPCVLFASCEPDEDLPIGNTPNFTWPEVLTDTELKQVTFDQDSWDFHCRWSNDSKKIGFARYNPNTRILSLIIYDTESGEETEIMSQSAAGDYCVSWSPDDKKISIDNRDENDYSQIYIVDIETKELTKFTNNRNNSFRPEWSNNGKYIAYCENGLIYYKPVDGGSAILISSVSQGWNPCWSPDDSKILYVKRPRIDDIYSVNLDGSENQLIASGKSGDNENWASWSSDGSKIMYQLFHSGVSKIAIKDLDSEEVYLISDLSDCRFPDWSPDGTKAVFTHKDKLWVLDMK